jgi:hypothetical protein
MASLEAAARTTAPHKQHPGRTSHSPGTGATRPPAEGPAHMTYDLDLTVLLTTVSITVLAVVYVWSKDPDRRARAWSLLKLLLGRND